MVIRVGMVAELPLSLRDFHLNEGDFGWDGMVFGGQLGFFCKNPESKARGFGLATTLEPNNTENRREP
jgi:hypothetical protein